MSGVLRFPHWMKSREARLRDEYRACFNTRAGQVVLKDLLDFGGVARADVVVDDNGQGTPFNAGLRRVALRITKYLNMTDIEVMNLAHRSADDGETD